jgi:hypothetical protein
MPKIKFEKTLLIGSGKITWYMKAQRWAKKQRFPVSFLLLGAIEWLKNFWIDVKIYNNMRDIDRQAEQLKKHWEEHDEPTTPHVVETGVFGDEGWSIEISNPVVERGTPTISTGMVTPSDAQRLQEDEGDKGTS